MRPQSAKAKGRRLQQLIASDLLHMFPQLEEDDIKSTSMGAGGEDVQLSASARRLIPFSFEAKNQERLNVWSAVEQARANAPRETDPVVVMKKNNEKAHVVVSWDCFKRLISPMTPPEALSLRAQLLSLSDELQRLASTVEPMDDAHAER